MPAEGFMPEPPTVSSPDPASVSTGIDETFVVVIGAEAVAPEIVAMLPANARVVAADSGTDHALAAGLQPEAVIGDLDSISAAGLTWARAHAEVISHPPEKDFTDTELALRHVADLHPARVILLSGGGDRLDHTMAAFGALGAPELTGIPVLECWWGGQYAMVLHGPARIKRSLEPGTRLSLLALHGPCSGVTVSGTQWELTNSELSALSGHGLSNLSVSPQVQIGLNSGVLTVFFPSPPTPPATSFSSRVTS
jgi:thiamine pyrophosphokinase